jgi:hypothetical protein
LQNPVVPELKSVQAGLEGKQVETNVTDDAMNANDAIIDGQEDVEYMEKKRLNLSLLSGAVDVALLWMLYRSGHNPGYGTLLALTGQAVFRCLLSNPLHPSHPVMRKQDNYDLEYLWES